MRKLSDFISWINGLDGTVIFSLKKLGDVLSRFSKDVMTVDDVGILAKDGKYDGLHLVSVIGDVAKFSDIDWDAVDSGDSDRYYRLYDQADLLVVLALGSQRSVDLHEIDLLKCATKIVVERYLFGKLSKQLAKSERTFNLTFEQVGSGRCVTDLEGYILEANQKFCEIIGYTHDEAMGIRIKHLTHPDDWLVDVVHKERLFKGEIPYFSMEKRYFKKDGSLVWVYTTVTLMKGEDGEDDFLIGIVQDISAQKSADIEVLTGLYNRRYMMSRLQDEYDRSRRSGRPFSLILTDIDYFKAINDAYGHDCGDEVLKGLAKVLINAVRSVDVLCRWGGEEFLMLLPDTDLDAARILADRIREAVADEVFDYEGNAFKLTMTFGVSSFLDTLTIKELIKMADQALYKGKAFGRNIVV